MFKIIGFLGLILSFSFSATAQAEQRKRPVCDGVKNFDTDVSVDLLQGDLRVLDLYSFADIEKNRDVDFFKWRRSDEDHFWISDDGVLKGYYRLGVGVTSNTVIKAVPRNKKQGFFCVFLEKVEMSIYHSSIAFVDSAFGDVECRTYKDKLVEHMNARHNQAVGTMMQRRNELLVAVKGQIEAMERIAVKKDKVSLKAARIQTALKKGAEKYSRLIFDEIVEANEALKADPSLSEDLKYCEEKLRFVVK